MSKAEEELTAIMDLLAEWQAENGGIGIQVCIHESGEGFAYDTKVEQIWISKDYGPTKEKEPGCGNSSGSVT